MVQIFRYQNKRSSDQRFFSAADLANNDDCQLIHEALKERTYLLEMPNHYPHPFGHRETYEERDAKENFFAEDWGIVSAFYHGYGPLGFDTVLLIHLVAPLMALVVELKDFQILHTIYEECEVIVSGNEEALSLDALREAFRSPVVKKKVAPIPSTPFLAPKKEAPKRIDLPKNPPKPKTNGYVPEFSSPSPEEEEEPIAVQVQGKWEANRSKKPGKIRLGLETRPAPKPAKKEETPQSPGPVPEKVEVAPTHLVVSKGKPRNLDEKKSAWLARPEITYSHDTSFLMGKIYLALPSDPGSNALIGKIRSSLSGVKKVFVNRACVFAPSLPEEGKFPQINYFRMFKAEDWEILAIDVDNRGYFLSCVLSRKDDPRFCVIYHRNDGIVVCCFDGLNVFLPPSQRLTFDALYRRVFPPKPKVEAPVEPEPVKAKETAREVIAPKPILAPKRDLTAKRRLFVTKAFNKDREQFERKYHGQAKKDFDEAIVDLLCLDDKALEDYLNRHDSKPIDQGKNGVTIYKFRFGTSGDYEAARLFYCRGYDLKRRMSSKDFLLLGLSGQDEHEEQGKIAKVFSSKFKGKRDMELYQLFPPKEEGGEAGELAYMSKKQFALVEQAKSALPAAFIGSAGTGKTLISLQQYADLKSNGGRVLYLTYQKALCDEVKKHLKDLGIESIEALTYRELCGSVFGESIASKMQTKPGFRKWFYSYVSRTGSVKKKLRAIGPTLEDQFMICYVFYRGVIDGSRLDYEKRRGRILSQEEFLFQMRNEEGFSAEEKATIYEVALAYEKQLQDGQTTDNKLASRILELGKAAERYDAIVIDEFQDLSELQFMAVLALLKNADPLPLYIYGDENQAINPTIFGLSDANGILRERYGHGLTFHVHNLTDSFRSGPNLVHYINDINVKKRKAIGARSLKEDVEVSLREDEEDLFSTLVEGKENLPRLIKLCAESAKSVVFIFPSESHREEVAKAYRHLAPAFVDASFLTVEKAKGREWDSVVLIDFFSSSRDLFDAMLGEERIGKHSTIHRMLFNRFYVALTRAKNRIVVYEEAPSRLIRRELLGGLTRLPNLDSLAEYFEGEGTDIGWLEFGKKLFEGHKYEDAYKAFDRADGEEAASWAALARRYMLAKRGDSTEEEAIALYREQLDYPSLIELYTDLGEDDKKSFLLAALDEESDPDYLREAYESVSPSLSPGEKKLFACLAAKAYLAHINVTLNSIIGGNPNG